MYSDLWNAQEKKLQVGLCLKVKIHVNIWQDVLIEANVETIDHVCEFLDNQIHEVYVIQD